MRYNVTDSTRRTNVTQVHYNAGNNGGYNDRFR